jgi:hypothetical protein
MRKKREAAEIVTTNHEAEQAVERSRAESGLNNTGSG